MRACDVSIAASSPFSSRRSTGGAIPRNAVHWLAAARTSRATGGVLDMLAGLKIGGSALGGRSSGGGGPPTGAMGTLECGFFFGSAGFFGGGGLGEAGTAVIAAGQAAYVRPAV